LILGFDLLIEDGSLITEYIGMGNHESVGAEVKVECRDMIYYIFDRSKISTMLNDFIPHETPAFKQTLNSDEVEKFFSVKNIPDEIKEVLGNNINSVVWK